MEMLLCYRHAHPGDAAAGHAADARQRPAPLLLRLLHLRHHRRAAVGRAAAQPLLPGAAVQPEPRGVSGGGEGRRRGGRAEGQRGVGAEVRRDKGTEGRRGGGAEGRRGGGAEGRRGGGAEQAGGSECVAGSMRREVRMEEGREGEGRRKGGRVGQRGVEDGRRQLWNEWRDRWTRRDSVTLGETEGDWTE